MHKEKVIDAPEMQVPSQFAYPGQNKSVHQTIPHALEEQKRHAELINKHSGRQNVKIKQD
jgi:hypothetical protein